MAPFLFVLAHLERPSPGKRAARAALALGAACLVAIHYRVFSEFLPNEHGKLGHDHALFLPYLLDGYFWERANGLWAVPWFTPSFCGGLPRFPNQYLYYSAPQFLTFLTDPLTSVRITLALFAGIGFAGFYLLLRRIFLLTSPPAFLGAALFLFNGLYGSRMIIGHLTFHAFMVIPLLTFFLLRPQPPGGTDRRARAWFDVVVAALLTAYVIHSGVAHLALPAGMIIMLVVLLAAIARPDAFAISTLASRLAATAGLGIGISSALLVGFFSLLRAFPRDLYPLPGVARLADVLVLAARSLFATPPHEAGNLLLLNTPWLMGRHEFEYGVTGIPLGIFLLGGISVIRTLRAGGRWRRPSPGQWLCTALACGLLALPIALNYYTPAWNAFLKRLPVIRNSSQNVRLFSVYIPVVILLASITLDRAALLRQHRRALAALGVAGLLAINVLTDRGAYHAERYDPRAVLAAAERVRSGRWSPVITHVAASVDEAGTPVLPLDRNDSLASGHSQLMCDETMFGYRLELFPRKTLRPGPVLEARDGVLNLKNPACYLFPAENRCSPGDHFTVGQEAAASAFARFRPFAFEMSAAQRAANVVNVALLLAVLSFLLWYGGRRLARKLVHRPMHR